LLYSQTYNSDNSIGAEGAKEISAALKQLKQLTNMNLNL
jgi:hypothetical protein